MAGTSGSFRTDREVFGELADGTAVPPHGGIQVVDLISKPVLYVVAILIGMVVTAAAVIVLKSAGHREPAPIEPAASREATATG